MPKFSFKRWTFSGIFLSLVLVFAIGISSYLSLSRLNKNQILIEKSRKEIDRYQTLITFLSELESNQRGYLITQNSEFLDICNNIYPQVDQYLRDLVALKTDSDIENNNIALKTLMHVRLQILKKAISLKKDGVNGRELSEVIILGREQSDKIKTIVSETVAKLDNTLKHRLEQSDRLFVQAVAVIVIGTLLVFLLVTLVFRFALKAFQSQFKTKNELLLKRTELEELLSENETRNWILQGTKIVGERIRGEISVDIMAQRIINNVAEYTQAKVGAIYLLSEQDGQNPMLTLKGGYAFPLDQQHAENYALNQTWVGQVASDKKATIVRGKIREDLKISTGLLTSEVYENLLVPFYFEEKLKGIIELGFTDELTAHTTIFLTEVAELLGVGINRSQARERLEKLFQQTQAQSDELEVQQEELRVTNEELTHKTEMLQASEEELRVQQEELREANTELEEKARLLSEKNHVIEEAREAILLKMEELELSGRYKSEFLANMSHELRTPLNSILILARILKDNKANNLSAEEEKYANVIFKSGNDLLQLINDILDLAKIESGKIELVYETIEIKEVADDLKLLFAEVAKSKDIKYHFAFEENLPKEVEIDRFRTEQILKNLLANAFKFTPANGEVKVSFTLHTPEKLKIEISDTGIGVSEEKQKLIFEAFQQADGSTSREFGGTGLGLSISKELAKYMGGEITLTSVVGKGSKFSLIIPLKQADALTPEQQQTAKLLDFTNRSQQFEEKIDTPLEVRKKSATEKPALLVVEDDQVFSDFLKNYGENKGFEVTQIYNGEQAFETALNLQPDAILLDVMLPGIDGWKVLKLLKSNIKTAHIPVHIMSAGDQRGAKAMQSGALSFIKKPIDINGLDHVFNQINMGETTPSYQNILLVEDQQVQSDALAEMFRKRNINVQQAFTGAETLTLLKQHSFDCLILDLHLPDVSGIDLLEQIKENEDYKHLPVIINTAMELDQEKTNRLLKYSDATVMKSTKSSDRILDEVNLFLHQVKLQEGKQKTKTNRVNTESLKDKIILLVDDDMRNIFALSAVLDGYGFKVEIANDGEEALMKIGGMEKVDLILMDIMMPKMDGYETIKAIRENPKWRKLPIIALTAKAMKEDRDLCINAGANDYITKPVDVDKLLSLIKVWLAG